MHWCIREHRVTQNECAIPTSLVRLTEVNILCILRMHLRALLNPSIDGSSELLCKSNHTLHQTHYGRTKRRKRRRRKSGGEEGETQSGRKDEGGRGRGRKVVMAIV